MKHWITGLLIFTATLSVFGQNTENEVDKAYKAVQDWYENPTFDTISKLDLSIMLQLQDSGRIENGLREGEWVLFHIDSAQIGKMIDVIIHGETYKMKDDPKIEKYVGNFEAGKKEGTWTAYKAFNYAPPFQWSKVSETDYLNDLPHGKEVYYHGFGLEDLDTIGVIYYSKGIETGTGRMFNLNPPYNLQRVYSLTQTGQPFLSEKYYDNGVLELKYTDTIIDDELFFHYTIFFESGNIQGTGYLNNNEIDRIYREYHESGQPFTEQEYRNGKLWNVSFIICSEGEYKDIGDFKNGKGTLNFYDKNGMLSKSAEYINGVEQNND